MQLLISSGDTRCFSLWPDPDVPPGFISEEQTYTLQLVADSDGDDLAGYHLVLGGVDQGAGRYERAGSLSWEWYASEYVGRVRVGLMQGNVERVVTGEISVDPSLQKLTQSQFSEMVEDIAEQALIAYSLSPATQGIALQQQWQQLGLSQLEYLRQQLSDLQRAVEAIAERPLRCLVRERVKVPFTSAPSADAGTLSELLRDLEKASQAPTTRLPKTTSRLRDRLRGTLPVDLTIDRKKTSFDVYENRLLKYFLGRLCRVLRRTSQRLFGAAKNPTLDPEIRELAARRAGELRQRQRVLYDLRDLDFLQDVAPLRSFKPVTPALRKDPLYARFYTLYRRFDRAISPFSEGPFQLSLEKTWQLYEYWCFLEVVAVLRELCQGSLAFDARGMLQPHKDGVSLSMPNAQIKINDCIWVYFQKTYSYYGWSNVVRSTKIGTYSHEMRPDISIEVRDDKGEMERIILLDPKYRASYSSINQALDDLHRYKDAILAPDRTRLVHTALVLCPTDAEAKSLYFDPTYIRTHGLGAIVLTPGMAVGHSVLKDTLCHLLGEHILTAVKPVHRET
ncbi:MAG: DUF2357 domain-containing protein [Anaerolineae bacterium]